MSQGQGRFGPNPTIQQPGTTRSSSQSIGIPLPGATTAMPFPPTTAPATSASSPPLEAATRIHQPMMSQMPFVGGIPPNVSSSATTHVQTTSLIGTIPDMDIFRKAPNSPVNPPTPSDFIRCTMSKVPRSQAILGKSKIPLGITVTPYPKTVDDQNVPVINGVIVRCRRCRSYLNPYVEQVDQGSRWRCNLCMLINEYPPSFDLDPATQTYVDRSSKMELRVPVYEFIAPVEYMIRAPQPPVFVFVIDVSYLAISTGMTATAAKIILDCLDQLPNEQGLSRISIIAVDSAIHFYNLGLSASTPQSLVVADLKDIVIPYLASDLLVSINECRHNVESILQRIATLFSNTQHSTVAFGSALNAACNLIAPIGGKVIGLLSCLPSVGEGSLQQREESKLYGTPREVSMLQPANTFFKLLATEASKNQVAVDLFLFPQHTLMLLRLVAYPSTQEVKSSFILASMQGEPKMLSNLQPISQLFLKPSLAWKPC